MAQRLKKAPHFVTSLNSFILTSSKAGKYSVFPVNPRFSIRHFGSFLGPRHSLRRKDFVTSSWWLRSCSRQYQRNGYNGKNFQIRSGYALSKIVGGAFAACLVYKLGDLWFSSAKISCPANSACCKESESYKVENEEYLNELMGTRSKPEPSNEWKIKLYQYQTCPFCCKVRAFLDYYGIEYEKIEVNPLMRKEIKFSEYRKVPIAILDDVQLNDSSLIISILRSCMLGKGSLEKLLVYYPKIETGDGKKTEYTNRHNVMYMQAMPTREKQLAVKEEMIWRKWVDSTFVHMLSPNIYRTLDESFQAFEYFSEVGNFSAFERFMAKKCGAIFMFVISKNLKKRYHLKDNVRESFYDEANKWVKAVGKKRKFMGGKAPNLADLSVYGVLSGIEGLDAFNDLMENTDIKPWYERVKKAVTSHQGQKEYRELMRQQADEVQ